MIHEGASSSRLAYPGEVLRLLTLRWWGRHALAVLLVLAFLALGRWQLDRGLAARGTLQNFGYTAEWFFLAGLTVYGWGRLALDEVRPGRKERRAVKAEEKSPTEAAGSWTQLGDADDAPAGPPVPAVDPELDAYNDYLARLNARPRR